VATMDSIWGARGEHPQTAPPTPDQHPNLWQPRAQHIDQGTGPRWELPPDSPAHSEAGPEPPCPEAFPLGARGSDRPRPSQTPLSREGQAGTEAERGLSPGPSHQRWGGGPSGGEALNPGPSAPRPPAGAHTPYSTAVTRSLPASPLPSLLPPLFSWPIPTPPRPPPHAPTPRPRQRGAGHLPAPPPPTPH